MEFTKEIKRDAYLWIGKAMNHKVVLVNFNGETHWIGIKEDGDDLLLYARKETLALSDEVLKAVYLLFPKYKDLNVGKVEASKVSKEFKVIDGDYNNTLLSKDIKILSEMTVKNKLVEFDFDVTGYEYALPKVDNSHTVKSRMITKGYKNYAQEALDQMDDVSDFKHYKLSNPGLVELVLNGMPKAMILAGPAGTGKTTEFKIACAHEEIPCYVIQFTANSDEDDFVGSFIPNTSDEGGSFTLKRSPFTYAYEYGGLVILDEINFASPKVLSIFNSALDNTAKIILDDGTEINRHEDFRVIATMNPNYAGTNRLNPAFIDRFDWFYWEPINKTIFKDRLKAETGFKNDNFLNVFYEEFDKFRKLYAARNMETEVTYRRALSFLQKFLAFPKGDIQMFFDVAFIDNTVALDLMDAERELGELKALSRESVKRLLEAYDISTQVEEKHFSVKEKPNLDDLASQLNSDGTFADLEV